MASIQLQEYAMEKFRSRERYYGAIQKELERGFAGCTQEEAVYMRFLYGTMPLRDAAEYGFSVFFSYVQHSLWLRENVEWCRELPEDIFIHHVLYYRVNSEDISDCRSFFYEKIRDRIADMELTEAVREINYWCAENAVYESTDGRTASPMTVYRCGKGRCGEESTFAVSAFRSVGIAARQVYAPRWSHCDDNHAWVEVYIHGKWYFLGACEPEEELNRGWFAAPASRAVLIHSRAFSDFSVGSSEECIGREDLTVYYNHTAAYARTCRLFVTVKDEAGEPVKGACVAVEILNMAEYYPAAVLITDSFGKTGITAGLGTVRVRAFQGNRFSERTMHLEGECGLEIVLGHTAENPDWVRDEWETEEVIAPKEYPMHTVVLTATQKERGERRLAEANRLREQRFAGCFREEKAAAYPEEADMLHIAGGNFTELFRFLTRDENPDRKRLLHSLSEKDYKDARAAVLEDHLDCERGDWTEEIYISYLLCPRVYMEELTVYRSFIRAYFTEDEKEAFRKNPDHIQTYILENIQYAPNEDYKTICATPVGCLKLKQGNPLAQKILFVAVCRSLGIPARLNRKTMMPEYLRGDLFTVPGKENGESGTQEKEAVLTLRAEDGGGWNYFQNWTIAKLEGTAFLTLDYEGVRFGEHSLRLLLKDGIYRLITTLRLPDGNQHVARRVFCLKQGEEKLVDMTLQKIDAGKMHMKQPLEDFILQEKDGRTHMLSGLVKEKPVILAFLGVGAEPTEHVLNELLECSCAWNESGAQLVAVLRRKEELENTTLRRVLGHVSGVRICFDQNGNAAKIAESMRVDGEKLPILAVVEEGPAGIYGCAGYNVGSVALMLKIWNLRVMN